MLKMWVTVLTRPNAEVFASVRDKPSASLLNALAWMFIASVVGGLIVFAREQLIEMWVIPGPEMEWPPPSKFRLELSKIWSNYAVAISRWKFGITQLFGEWWRDSGLYAIGYAYADSLVKFLGPSLSTIRWDKMLLSPVYFMVKVSVYHFIARFLGGRGKFARFAFVVAAFSAPLTVLIPLLGYLALIGVGLATALPNVSHMTGQYWFYDIQFYVNTSFYFILPVCWLFLMFLAAKVTYGMESWRSVLVVVTARELIVASKIIALHGLLLGLFVSI